MTSADFNDWVIRIKYEWERTIDDSSIKLDHETKRFILHIGLRPSIYDGLIYTHRDVPLLEAHEIGHVKSFIAGKSEFIANIVFSRFRTRADFFLERAKQERIAWKIALYNMPFLNNDWLEKAQSLLTDHLFKLYEYYGLQLRGL